MNLTDAIDSVADRPEPSEAQAKAGNYRKGPVSLHGMRISIENPQGSIRRGKSADGTPWASQLTHHYGYIRGAWGRDKDHLDIYLGPDAESADRVFVVDQLDPDNAKFDEHKVMLGFKDADDAREAYLDQFPEGWSGLGGVTELPLSSFKKWAFRQGRRVKPLSTEFAEATAQHYAGGGSVEPQATPITDDMYAEALARFPARAQPHMGKRPEAHNNRAASAEMPLTAARAALATVLGTPGDLESLVRMITPGADEHAALPTTEFYREWLPTGGLDRTGPHGQLAEGVTDAAILATLPGPLTKLAGALRRGAAKAGTKAADAMDSWRDSYIPRKADIDVILDRAGNVLNPRPALPAYAEGGGVEAINDYSDAQYAAAREWAAGKTGAEVAAKGTELGLTADQFARVLGNPAITGADVAANGYGTTGGLNAAYMNATYDAPGQFTNPTETIATGTWQGGSGANATELANAQAWSTGKTGAQIAAQAQAMGLTPEQMYQVFGQHQYGVGVGKQNMTWDGTQFVTTPDDSYAPAAPQVSLPQTPPGPQAPVAPQPEVYAPTAYLQQTAAGNQSWRQGAPGAQTGWTGAPRYGAGGAVRGLGALKRIKAGDLVDGLVVREQIPNMSSIGASLGDDYKSYGLREVPLKAFRDLPDMPQDTPRLRALREAIADSGELNPLIVPFDKQGPYILEGGHRFDVLRQRGAKSFPAWVVKEYAEGGSVGDTYSFLPTLNANYVDSLFKAYEGNPYLLNSLPADGLVNGEELGWKLGGNNSQSYIRRGADALGVIYRPEVISNEAETGTQYRSPAQFTNLRGVADSVGFDLSPYMRKVEAMPAGYRDVDSGPTEGGSQIVSQWFDAQPESQELDEAKAYAALNEQFRDVYRVSGHRDTIGDGGAGSLDFVNSLYRRDGDNLLPVSGTHQFVKGKENSKGFFGDIASDLAPVLPLALSFVPGLQGLATTLGSGLGLSGAAASAIGSGVMGGALSSLTGGEFGKGFLGGAVGGGLTSMGLGTDIFPDLPGGAKAFDSTLGNVGKAIVTGQDPSKAVVGGALNYGLASGIDGLNLDPSTANTLKLLAGPVLRGQNPLTPSNLLKLATQP